MAQLPTLHLQGDDDDLALLVALHRGAGGHAVRAAELARVGQVADLIGHVGEVERVRAAVVRERRRQLVARGRVARALDHAGGCTAPPRPAPRRRSGRRRAWCRRRRAAPAPACAGCWRGSRRGAARRGAASRCGPTCSRMSVSGVMSWPREEGAEPLRLAGPQRGAAGLEVDRLLRAAAGGDELGVLERADRLLLAGGERQDGGEGQRAGAKRPAATGSGGSHRRGPYLKTKPDGPARRRWPMAVLHRLAPARVALEAAEQDALEVVRRHEVVHRRRDPPARGRVDDHRRHDDDELALPALEGLAAEERAEHRHRPERRHARGGLRGGVLHQPGDGEALAAGEVDRRLRPPRAAATAPSRSGRSRARSPRCRPSG